MTRPYCKAGYRTRRRVHLRVDDSIIDALDDLAGSLSLSRAYLCDLILGIAVDEGGDWLKKAISKRVSDSLARYRKPGGSSRS